MARCPLLSKYFVDTEAGANYRCEIDRWIARICIEWCPLIKSNEECVEGRYMSSTERFRLKITELPCPHCNATDQWRAVESDGIHCIHCGCVIPRPFRNA